MINQNNQGATLHQLVHFLFKRCGQVKIDLSQVKMARLLLTYSASMHLSSTHFASQAL